MRVTAKADYAVRAVIKLADGDGNPVKRDEIVAAEKIPPKFLENILSELRRAGLVESQRGSDGGYWLSRPARRSRRRGDAGGRGPAGERPQPPTRNTRVRGARRTLQLVWVALRSTIRSVLEEVTIADLISGELPAR